MVAVGTWNLENLFRPGGEFGPPDEAAYEAKLASLAGVIDRLAPDVLGVQEVGDPLALADLIGLDTMHAVAESMYAEFKEPLYAPPPLLLRMVEAGLLGRKSGRGFFSYDGSRA